MIDRDRLEAIILGVCEKRGFFSRDFRQYQISENDMWLVCDDLMAALDITEPQREKAA